MRRAGRLKVIKMKETIDRKRFSDRGELLDEFGDEFLVVCPRCGRRASVASEAADTEKLGARLTAPRRLICFFCPHRDRWARGTIAVGGNHDWYFRLPLWLEISCRGERLWAYNEKHLAFIERYVRARLRRRAPLRNKSVASRFPRWLTSAKNRAAILRAIGKLRAKANN